MHNSRIVRRRWQFVAHGGVIRIGAGEGVQLVEQGGAAGEIVLGVDVEKRVGHAAGQLFTHGGVIGVGAGEGAQFVEQGVEVGVAVGVLVEAVEQAAGQ